MAKPKEESAKPTRDLIPTGIMTEFGELLDDPTYSDAMGGQRTDLVYTPGWSELRYQRDVQMGEVAKGLRRPQDVIALPGNVVLARRTSPSGKPDGQKVTKGSMHGYRPITQADIGQPWFTAMPPGTEVLADGTIAKGDCVYLYCPPEQAARNAYKKDRTTRQRLTGAADRAENASVTYESTTMQPLTGAPPSKINVS